MLIDHEQTFIHLYYFYLKEFGLKFCQCVSVA